MNLEDLAALIRSRRSVRQWIERPVPEEIILRALELATWAPNGGNRQAWHFCVVTRRDLIEGIADAVEAQAEKIASWPESRAFGDAAHRWKRTVGFFRHAPGCIAVLMGEYLSIADKILLRRMAVDPDAREIFEGRRLGSTRLQSVAAGVSYLLLGLHAQGLGAVWMAAPQQAKKEIEAILQVPEGSHFVALVPFGYPAQIPPPKPRKPLEEVVTFYR